MSVRRTGWQAGSAYAQTRSDPSSRLPSRRAAKAGTRPSTWLAFTLAFTAVAIGRRGCRHWEPPQELLIEINGGVAAMAAGSGSGHIRPRFDGSAVEAKCCRWCPLTPSGEESWAIRRPSKRPAFTELLAAIAGKPTGRLELPTPSLRVIGPTRLFFLQIDTFCFTTPRHDRKGTAFLDEKCSPSPSTTALGERPLHLL
jgi:hypothetical protein